MGTSPDQLREDIEQTRAELTHNVDTLAEKVSPSAVAHRRVEDAKGALSGVKEKVMGSSQTAGSHLSDAGSALSDKASGIGSSLSDRASSVGDSVTSAPGAMKQRAQGNPLAAGIIAFGAGLLVSSLIPASQKEQHAALALKDKAEPLTNQVKDEAKQQAQQMKESLAPVAQDAVEQVKSTAQDAAATTKEHASSAAGEVADHAKSAASDTKVDVADHAADAKDELKSGSGSGETVYPSDPLVETEAPTHPNFVH
jgi:hypothetical protein